MNEYKGMHDLWRRDKIVIGYDDEVTSLATGNVNALLQEAADIRLILRTAMVTSLISYQLNKSERNL